MDVLDEEVLRLWKILYKYEVRYILVGGFATNLNGFSRFTADLDLWLDDTAANRKLFRKALAEAEIGDFESLETIEMIPGWSSIYLNSGIELDIMTSLKGFPKERFEDCYNLAPTILIHDVPVRFLHKNHLIEAKLALGRPKDLNDIEELRKLD
ncbi:MAG: DUF6036 family nucleotidyltransferase [Bacteroidia bacterium]|jgi:hypothetical protein